MPSWQSHILKLIFRLRRIISPPDDKLDVVKARSDSEALASKFKAKVQFTSTPVVLNSVPGEWIKPHGPLTECIILFFHGGGYYSGSIVSHRYLVANIANSARARALIIDYRLAPENPFPAAIEDAITAYQWLISNGYNSNHIVVAGDSCGGGMAISILISQRDANEPLPAAAVCLSPWLDLACTGESWKGNADKDLMNDLGSNLESARYYLGETDPKTPLASPLYADLKCLPPILVQVGSDEIILSDSTSFAEKAQAAGIDIQLEVWEGMQHEWHFAANFMPEAQQAVDQIGEFINKIQKSL